MGSRVHELTNSRRTKIKRMLNELQFKVTDGFRTVCGGGFVRICLQGGFINTVGSVVIESLLRKELFWVRFLPFLG